MNLILSRVDCTLEIAVRTTPTAASNTQERRRLSKFLNPTEMWECSSLDPLLVAFLHQSVTWSFIHDTTCLATSIGLRSLVSMMWLFQGTTVISSEFHTCQHICSQP